MAKINLALKPFRGQASHLAALRLQRRGRVTVKNSWACSDANGEAVTQREPARLKSKTNQNDNSVRSKIFVEPDHERISKPRRGGIFIPA